MDVLAAMRAACMEELAAYLARPTWNIREYDRQFALAARLGALLDGDGVPIREVSGGKQGFADYAGGARTRRVHAELKVLVPGDPRPRNGVSRTDVVILGMEGVSLRRDGYGPLNVELAVPIADVAAVMEVKAESLDWRGNDRDPAEHGSLADFRKLKTLAIAAYAKAHDPARIFGMFVIDTGLPPSPSFGWTAWRTRRREGWEWPRVGEDRDNSAPDELTVRCWSLQALEDDTLVPSEWVWRPRQGWALQPTSGPTGEIGSP